MPSAAQLTRLDIMADGPIEGATATRLDPGPDLGLAGPPKGRPPGTLFSCRPLGDGPALGDRDGELGFLDLWWNSPAMTPIGHTMARFHRASVCPAHGSQPGAQAGRHALEGLEMCEMARSQTGRIDPLGRRSADQRHKVTDRVSITTDDGQMNRSCRRPWPSGENPAMRNYRSYLDYTTPNQNCQPRYPILNMESERNILLATGLKLFFSRIILWNFVRRDDEQAGNDFPKFGLCSHGRPFRPWRGRRTMLESNSVL